jgi:hypothetical protein
MSETDLPLYDDDPAAWTGPELARDPGRWTYRLTDAQVSELEETARRLDAERRDIVAITAADAPLPALAEKLGSFEKDLLFGIGFCLIRGVPVDRLTLRQSAIAFWCLGAHLGNAVSQNAKGHALGHVRDLGFDYSKPSARGYQTSERLPYHCDMGDVVGLLSLRTGKSGGLSTLVSSVTLYNAMVRARPDLVRVLMQPTWRDRRDEIPEGKKPWYPMPVFNPFGGRMFTHYVRSVIRKAQRFEEVPRISAEQEEALDYLDALANGPDYHLDMEFQPGDVQFLCNHTIMHSRTKYVDWDEPERKRHLLRLWLACPGGPAVPESYREFQGLNAAGRPQGIKCPGAVLNAPLEAEDGGAGETEKRLPDAVA